MTTQVTKSFTSVTTSAQLVVSRDQPVTVALSGTYVASVQLERASTPDGSAFEKVAGPWKTANATVSAIYTPKKATEVLRLRTTSYTSGTAVTSMTSAALEAVTKKALDGTQLSTENSDGIKFGGGVGHGAPVAAGATKTLDERTHAGRTILLDTAAGSVVTLPTSTGKGAVYRFIVKTLVTSNSHKIQVGNATDVIQGLIMVLSDDSAAVIAFAAAGTSDTISLNKTTTGSVSIGEYIEIVDYAAGFFAVHGFTSATGTEATPFSAAVS